MKSYPYLNALKLESGVMQVGVRFFDLPERYTFKRCIWKTFLDVAQDCVFINKEFKVDVVLSLDDESFSMHPLQDELKLKLKKHWFPFDHAAIYNLDDDSLYALVYLNCKVNPQVGGTCTVLWNPNGLLTYDRATYEQIGSAKI